MGLVIQHNCGFEEIHAISGESIFGSSFGGDDHLSTGTKPTSVIPRHLHLEVFKSLQLYLFFIHFTTSTLRLLRKRVRISFRFYSQFIFLSYQQSSCPASCTPRYLPFQECVLYAMEARSHSCHSL